MNFSWFPRRFRTHCPVRASHICLAWLDNCNRLLAARLSCPTALNKVAKVLQHPAHELRSTMGLVEFPDSIGSIPYTGCKQNEAPSKYMSHLGRTACTALASILPECAIDLLHLAIGSGMISEILYTPSTGLQGNCILVLEYCLVAHIRLFSAHTRTAQ